MAENPFLNPNAEVEAASRLSRLAARFLDGLLFLAPLPLLFLGLPALLLGFVALIVGQVWLLLSRGQTLGKKAMDIYIMRSDGGLPHLGWLLLREFAIPAAVGVLRYAGRHDPSPIGQAFQVLLGFVGLIDVLFIFSPTRRCLHDLVAGTHVVKLG
jgi:uncharacterized RDD family membrane protein YckC